MPNLFLYALTADNRFKCRLAGSAIRQAFGNEPTGRYLDEIINPAGVASRTALFRATLERELPVGAPVVIIGQGVLAEAHARVAGTINYELTCGIETDPLRARRTVVDG